MLFFQTLDDKSECVGIYANGELIFDVKDFPPELSHTWKYSSYLRELDVEYVSLYLEGKPLPENIPEFLKEDWDDACKKMQAYKRCLSISQVDTMDNCFYDLVPRRFLVEFCRVKNTIVKHIAKNFPKPRRYKFYKNVAMMLGDIENRPISIDRQKVSTYLNTKKLHNHARSILQAKPYVKYNQFGTKTGRLTSSKGYFPILTLSKEFRTAVVPTNDFFVELDFNGAEVRVLMGLLGLEQPSQDVHSFHIQNIFNGLSRNEAKVAFFAWLYGSKNAAGIPEMEKLSEYYNKEELLRKYWIDNTVKTPYGKEIINSSKHHALNYLVQSTCAELTLNQAVKIDYLMRTQSQGSHVAYLIHDAIVLDMKKEDEHLLKKAGYLMESTNFGKFKINTSVGKNLGF
jgi:hypothetical protein